jgi:membrane protein involved in colicin uptake
MATKLVNIVKSFTLTIVRDGQLVLEKVEAGIQRLEEDVAGHWYTEAHSAPVPKGVTQTDAEAQAEADAAELAKMEAEEKAAAEAKAAEEKAAADAKAKADAAAKKS